MKRHIRTSIISGLRLYGALSGAAFLLGACSAQPSTYEIRTLYQARQCPPADQTLRLVENEKELRLLTRPRLLSAEPPTIEADFGVEWVLLAAWGQKPNAGYRVSVTADQAEREGNTLVLPLRFDEPAPGTMQAQVMTSPCVVLAFPKGDYERLRAEDLTVDLPD